MSTFQDFSHYVWSQKDSKCTILKKNNLFPGMNLISEYTFFKIWWPFFKILVLFFCSTPMAFTNIPKGPFSKLGNGQFFKIIFFWEIPTRQTRGLTIRQWFSTNSKVLKLPQSVIQINKLVSLFSLTLNFPYCERIKVERHKSLT